MRKYTPSRIVIAIILGILLATGHGVVLSQQQALQVAEPKRFALVIGNAKYGDPIGTLPALGSPCSDDKDQKTDVTVIADALSSAQWEVESICNLSTQKLRDKIDLFTDRVLTEERAFGIVYFSGHGAQVGGANYLFGIDAIFDENTEVKKYEQNSDAPLFGQSAVQLDYAMRKLTHLWGKAVVFIVDACRDNPIVEKLLERKINTARYPAASSQVPNVVYAFATETGAVAPDGGMGSTSRYARFLAESIRKSTDSKDVEIEQVLTVARTNVMKETHAAQVPGTIGDLQRPPIFCIKGCPSRMEDWISWNAQFAALPLPQLPAPTSRRMTMQAVKYNLDAAPSFAQETPANMPTQPPAANEGIVVAPKQQLRVDILYCVGDAFAAARQAKSDSLKGDLQSLTGTRSPVAGFDIGAVNTVPLPPKTNRAIYHAWDSKVVYNAGSPAQRNWAEHISKSVSPPLRLVEQPGTASDFLTVLLCDQVDLDKKPVLVYLHVADEAQKASAQLLRSSLQTAFPSADIPRGIEVVKKSPEKSQLRYFQRDQAASAAKLADAASDILHERVEPRLIKGYEEKLKGSNAMELWIGKTTDLNKAPVD